MNDDELILDITTEETERLLDMWVEKNLTKESVSVYAKNRNMEAAILNEAVIDVLKEIIEKEK